MPHSSGMAESPTASAALPEPDAARYVGYSPATLKLWRREGRGPSYLRHGRSIRYLVVDLDNWITRHRVAIDDGVAR